MKHESLVDVFAIEGQCTLTLHTRTHGADCYRTNCGLHFTKKLIEMSEYGLLNQNVTIKMAAAHRIHHENVHPPFEPHGYMDIVEHFDPLDGEWSEVSCHHGE